MNYEFKRIEEALWAVGLAALTTFAFTLAEADFSDVKTWGAIGISALGRAIPAAAIALLAVLRKT